MERPSPPAGSMEFVLGIDIGGTNLRIGAVGRDGGILHYSMESSRQLFQRPDSAEALSGRIAAYLSQMSGTLRGICVGLPGTVRKDKRYVLSCPNLPALNGLDLGGMLYRRFHVPVLCEHDVILLLVNDVDVLGISGEDCVVAYYVGTGLGNALRIYGRFLDGKNGVSGELGHIPVLGRTDPCPCGNKGCMELYASGKRLEQIREACFPDMEDFSEIFTRHARHPAIEEFLDCVAAAVAIEVNILDPDTVVLSGGVLNMADFPYEALLARVRAHIRKPFPDRGLVFRRGDLDKRAGIRGAGIYLWERLSSVRTMDCDFPAV